MYCNVLSCNVMCCDVCVCLALVYVVQRALFLFVPGELRCTVSDVAVPILKGD